MSAAWPYNDIRERQLRALALRDMEHYIRVMRIGVRILATCETKTPDKPTIALWNDVVFAAMGEYDRPATPQELTYATLRVRHRLSHKKAAAEASMGRVHEYVLEARKPVATAFADELRKLADESKITREDVVQGLLNAVSTAANSKELMEAWRELGRLHGYYEETKINIQQTVKNETTITHRLEGVDLRMLSDEALMEHAGADLLRRIAPSAPLRIEQQPVDAEFTEVFHTPIEKLRIVQQELSDDPRASVRRVAE